MKVKKFNFFKKKIRRLPRRFKYLEPQLILFQEGLNGVFTQIFLVNLEKDQIITDFTTPDKFSHKVQSYTEAYEFQKRTTTGDIDLDTYFSFENLKAHFEYSREPLSVKVESQIDARRHFYQVIVTPVFSPRHEKMALFFVRNIDSEKELEQFKTQMQVEHERNITRRHLIEENYNTAAEVDLKTWKVHFLLRPMMDLENDVDCTVAVEKYIELFADSEEEGEIRRFFSKERCIKTIQEYDECSADFKKHIPNDPQTHYSRWKFSKLASNREIILVREIDITNIKRAEQTQFLANQYHHALLSDALVVYNANISKNLIEEDIFEVTKERKTPLLPLVNLEVPCPITAWLTARTEFVSPDYRQQYRSTLDPSNILRTFKDGIREINFEYETIDTTGKSIFVAHTVLITEAPNSKNVIAMNIIKNITDSHEHEIRQKMELQIALQNAENANRAKTEFLSNVSHDIRTPMNAIRGLTALAMGDPGDTERVREYLKKIDTASEHLLTLINNVLDISRIESNRINLREDKFSICELLTRISTIIFPQIKNNRQQLELHTINIKNEFFIGDLLHINLILINILGNAIKFTPSGGNIVFSIEELTPASLGSVTRYSFKISDNGCGMTKEFLQKIYEPFTRENNQQTTKIEGSGLGLSITKKLIDLMHGTIDVESEVGKGTTFTIELELKKDEEPAEYVEGLKKIEEETFLFISVDANFRNDIIKPLIRTGLQCKCIGPLQEAVEVISKGEETFSTIFISCRSEEAAFIRSRKIREVTGDKSKIVILPVFETFSETHLSDSPDIFGAINFPFLRSTLIHTLYHSKEPEKKDTDEIPNFTGKRILIAEDNELNMMVARAFLSKTGVTLIEAPNGEEALELFTASNKTMEKFDLIFMDVQMPVMDGYDTVRKIRMISGDYAQNVPIIAMTANIFLEDQNNAFKAGMNDYITKPINVKTLYDKASKYLFSKDYSNTNEKEKLSNYIREVKNPAKERYTEIRKKIDEMQSLKLQDEEVRKAKNNLSDAEKQNSTDSAVTSKTKKTADKKVETRTAEPQNMSVSKDTSKAEKRAEGDFSGKNILVVDDNNLNLEIINLMLKTTGANLTLKMDGQEALDAFLASPEGYYDIILMDIQMPVMDGHESAKRIRSSGRSDSDLPIIAISANAFPEDKEKSKEAGINFHMSKPVIMKELHKIISNYVNP